MTENFIKNSIFLYLDPQKNRTDTWFHSLRLQLPSGKTMYGSIGKISYADGDVKIQGVPWEKLLNRSLNYIQTDAEAAAYQAIPQVLKRGIPLSGHEDHKGQGFCSAENG